MSDGLPAPGNVTADRPHEAVADSKEWRCAPHALTTALAGLTIAATLAAPAAYAMPVDQTTPGATREVSDVPPPPSSIAASAAEEYEQLRAAGASQPVAAEPSAPGGFDWVSAAIGAVAAAGVAVVSVAMLGMRKPAARRAASA